MNDNIRAAIIEGSKSLTPGMADRVEQALQAQRLAIKEANAKEEVNRKTKLKNEVEVQKQIAGISVPEESAYGEVDIANQIKGLVSTYTADRLAIKQGTATDEQVKRSVALDTYFTNMGDTFGTMSYVVDEFIKTKNDKGTDGMEEGSIDLSTLDPYFNELINILDQNSTAKGSVSIDIEYKDGKVKTYQVVESEAIREENRRRYESEQDPELKKQYLDENGEISDTYKLSYDKIKNFVNNKNNNSYLVGNQFGTVPGVSSVVDYAKKNNILESDGSPKNDYMSQVPFQKTINQNGKRVVVDVTRPEVNKIAGSLKVEADSLTRLMFGGGENSAYASFIKANFSKFKGSTIDKDGNIMVYLPKRNEAGEYELDGNGNFIPEDSPTEMGSSSLSGGRFNMRTGVDNQYLGMTKEDFDKANRFTQDVAMMNLNLNGASKEEINKDATKKLNELPKELSISEQKLSLNKIRTSRIIEKIGNLGSETLTENKIKEFNRYLKDQIQGIEGYDVFTADGVKTYGTLYGDLDLEELNKRRLKENKPPVKSTDVMPAGAIFFSSSTGKVETIDLEEFNIIDPKDRASLALYIETIRGVPYSEKGQSVLEALRAK
ncbi:MAG: hypothetical protein CMJ25_13480 [Phycisphaerae bacterium]|nr:hypothetical protein [Phycisphaerae bacterium]|tara:strand:+ start:5304 stop:7121 length:1818 start_codon:yes stop_codon:yes gene_type:complete